MREDNDDKTKLPLPKIFTAFDLKVSFSRLNFCLLSYTCLPEIGLILGPSLFSLCAAIRLVTNTRILPNKRLLLTGLIIGGRTTNSLILRPLFQMRVLPNHALLWANKFSPTFTVNIINRLCHEKV